MNKRILSLLTALIITITSALSFSAVFANNANNHSSYIGNWKSDDGWVDLNILNFEDNKVTYTLTVYVLNLTIKDAIFDGNCAYAEFNEPIENKYSSTQQYAIGNIKMYFNDNNITLEWTQKNNTEGEYYTQTFKLSNPEYALDDPTEIKVFVNGKKVIFDQKPILENDRTLVPVRAIFEALGATVSWDDTTETVTSEGYGTTIQLQIGSNEMKVGNEIKYLDVPAKILNDRTLVPVRAISEAFGCTVDWDGDNNTVIITK